MPLELINTLGTLTTVVIVATAAIAALVQLRHLREGNQITALLAVQSEFDDSSYRDAVLLARHELRDALEDPAFCAYCVAVVKGEPTTPDPAHEKLRQAVVLMGNIYENLGALVKRGIFDRGLFLDTYSDTTDGIWDRLEEWIALSRAAHGSDILFENFEYITVIARRHLAAHPVAYPPGVPRLKLRLPKGAQGLV